MGNAGIIRGSRALTPTVAKTSSPGRFDRARFRGLSSGDVISEWRKIVGKDSEPIASDVQPHLSPVARELTEVIKKHDRWGHVAAWYQDPSNLPNVRYGNGILEDIALFIGARPQFKPFINDVAAAILSGIGVYQSAAPAENHNGLPLIDASTFSQLYNTDVHAMGQGQTVTFDYQGYIRDMGSAAGPGTFYRDVMATNGVLSGEGHEGAHIGTDGIMSYSTPMRNITMTSARDVREYNIYIRMSGEVQRALRCVVHWDSVYSIGKFEESFYDQYDDESLAEQLTSAQDSAQDIFIRLSLDPQTDPLAREKVRTIHHAIVKHIEEKRPGHLLASMVMELEDELMGITAAELRALQNR